MSYNLKRRRQSVAENIAKVLGLFNGNALSPIAKITRCYM